MNTLLVATTNPGKLKELTAFLSDLPIRIVGLNDVGITDIVDETGNTLEENAVLKATYYHQKSGLVTLADDGGFEIDALGGAPGVKSRRWIHGVTESTDEELIAYTMKQMANIPIEKRGAQLRLVLALVTRDGHVYCRESKVRGVIALQPSEHRYAGFPFRSVLYLPEIHKYYSPDGLTHEELLQYNHRKIAVDQLKPIILSALTNEEDQLQ